MPTNLVTLPPVVRTALYYVLALANAVLVPLTASGRVDPDISLIVVGISGVFGFTLAASNVSKPVAQDVGSVYVNVVGDPQETAETIARRVAHILPVNPPVDPPVTARRPFTE